MSKHIKQEGCLIYDENERTLESSVINEKTEFIPLVHIEGIKFSSKSFQIEINVRQIMIMSLEDNIKNNCLIKNKNLPNNLENGENKTLETLENKQIDNLENREDVDREISDNNNNDNNLEISDKTNNLDELGEISEINLDVETIDDNDNISLKNPNEVYYEIYKAAYDKAKQIKKAALEAHMEAKKIKLKYNLDDIIQSDDEFDGFSEIED